MAAATVTWDEIASCGRKRVVVGKDGEGLVACGIEGCGRRRGGVWRSVGVVFAAMMVSVILVCGGVVLVGM